jgi:glutathione S-transferase
MSNIVLYDLPGCPFCAIVKDKLDELDLDYDVIEVPRSHAQRTEVKQVSGQTGVPVIVDEDHGVEGMPESSDIVEYLEQTYGDGEV